MNKQITFPFDATGIQVGIGDKVKGEGFLTFQDGFKIDRTPVVTVREHNGILMFGQLSAKSFPRFWIVEKSPINADKKDNCSKCGNEYDDFLGIGYCGACFNKLFTNLTQQ